MTSPAAIVFLYRLMTQRSRNKQTRRRDQIAAWNKADNKTEAEWEAIWAGYRRENEVLTAMMTPEQRNNMHRDNEEFEAMLRKAHEHD